MRAEIESLEQLARVDARLTELSAEYLAESEKLEGLRQSLSRLEQKLERTAGGVDDMEKLRSELVTEIRMVSTQRERSRDKLQRSRNEKEVNAAQRELEELARIQREREHEVEKLLQLAEQARVEREALAEQQAQLVAQLGGTEGASGARLAELGAERDVLETERLKLLEGIPRALARRYETVRRRRDDALSHTHDGTCAKCHVEMPPMLFQELYRTRVVGTCPSCVRLIYYRAPVLDASLGDSET